MWRTASILVGVVLVLLTLGLVMLTSTSVVQGETLFGDPLYFVKRQVIWLLVAGLAGAAASQIPYKVWQAAAMPAAVVTIAALVMAVLPGIGQNVKGSSRWLKLGLLSFQPSELAKLTSVILLAWWMSRIQRRASELIRGMLIPMASLGVILFLVFIEPDFGTTILLAAVGMSIMFVAGARIWYLLIAAIVGLTGFFLAVMKNAERMERVIAFLNPQKYAQDAAYQLLNAIYAFVIGGAAGVGLGQSIQKRFYLPEAHTDFIYAILGEELGMTASLLVVVLFLAIFFCGLRISLRAPDDFGKLLGFGITVMIVLQAIINIAVVTGCMPTKGLPLPFISFGGSSLVISMTMIGILVNLARHAVSADEIETHVIKDRGHRF